VGAPSGRGAGPAPGVQRACLGTVIYPRAAHGPPSAIAAGPSGARRPPCKCNSPHPSAPQKRAERAPARAPRPGDRLGCRRVRLGPCSYRVLATRGARAFSTSVGAGSRGAAGFPCGEQRARAAARPETVKLGGASRGRGRTAAATVRSGAKGPRPTRGAAARGARGRGHGPPAPLDGPAGRAGGGARPMRGLELPGWLAEGKCEGVWGARKCRAADRAGHMAARVGYFSGEGTRQISDVHYTRRPHG
jgi:hypothetical protein